MQTSNALLMPVNFQKKAGNALQSLLNVQATKALKKTIDGSFIECSSW